MFSVPKNTSKLSVFVESVYRKNLTPDILVMHPKDNIIQVIKYFILESNITLKKINDLCSNGEHLYTAEDTMCILKYVMN